MSTFGGEDGWRGQLGESRSQQPQQQQQQQGTPNDSPLQSTTGQPREESMDSLKDSTTSSSSSSPSQANNTASTSELDSKKLPYTSVSLSQAIVRSLSDRSYEKRKTGAIEVEKMVREKTARDGQGEEYVVTMINILTMDFACSINSNQRKGGLIGLAAVALGLGASLTPKFLQYLLPPVLKCFDDPEVRVRYYACEALYNITKVARKHILAYFNALFDGLCKLFADVDVDVKNGAQLLDRLVKEVVTENCDTFQVDVFIPLLEKYLKMTNPYIRQFLLGWILALDSVPELDMLVRLPKFLDGLFNMLSDGNREIRQQSDMALGRFLQEIQSDSGNRLEEKHVVAIVSILVEQTSSAQKFNRLTAASWILQFIDLFGERLVLMYSAILDVLLTTLGDNEAEIKTVADKAHEKLLELVSNSDVPFSLRPVIVVVAQKLAVPLSDEKDQLNQRQQSQQPPSLPSSTVVGGVGPVDPTQESKGRYVGNGKNGNNKSSSGTIASTPLGTRMAALRWISMLLDKFPGEMEEHLSKLTPAMLSALSDPSDDLVVVDLDVLARIARNTSRMDQVIGQVIKLFQSDTGLFDSRGTFIIRKLCVLLEPGVVFVILANEIDKETDIEFAHLMVQALNLILLTAPELSSFRTKLKESWQRCCSGDGLEALQNYSISQPSPLDVGVGELDEKYIFVLLFKTWCFDPVATLSLCLLSECYDLSSRLVIELSRVNLTVGFLMEVDKLVQLLESPAFLSLRLELVNTASQSRKSLLKTLYGLLMILPQSGAYSTLSNRLNAAASLHLAVCSHETPESLAETTPTQIQAQTSTGASSSKSKHFFSKFKDSQASHPPAGAEQQTSHTSLAATKVAVEEHLLDHFVKVQSKIVQTFEQSIHSKSLFRNK